MISYISYVHQLKQRNKYDMDCIIAMDETAVWHEMISNTAVTDKGEKSVVLKKQVMKIAKQLSLRLLRQMVMS